MEKTKCAGICAALIAVLSLVLFTGCSSGGTEAALSGENTLIDITIAGVTPDGGTIPEPISSSDWNDTSIFGFSSLGNFTLPGAALAGAEIETEVTGGTVKYWIGLDSERASATFTAANARIFSSGDTLFVQVTAVSGAVKYYKFIIMTESTSTNLSSLSIAGVSAGRGSPAATWDDPSLIKGSVSLSNAQKEDAAVVAAIPTNATVKFAVVAKDSSAAPDFDAGIAGPNATITFVDGDFLYVKVTAADGITVGIYKVELEIGRNANLNRVSIGTGTGSGSTWQNSTGEDSYLGTPADTWEEAEVGNFQTDRQLPVGLTIRVQPQDPEARLEYAIVEETEPSTEPGTWTDFTMTGTGVNTTGTIAAYQYDAGTTYHLYIKVTAAAGNKLYYKLKIVLPRTSKILYGQPELTDPSGNFYYDAAVWDQSENGEFVIDRINTAESVANYMKQPWGLHTSAVAKALWDDEGIYVYVNVTTKQFQRTETGALQDRPIAIPPQPDNISSAHQGDSVEVFVNERLQVLSTTNRNIGNQFRVGVNGFRSGAGTLGTAVADFTANGTRVVRIKGEDGKATTGQDGGYEVLLFVPFAGKTHADAADVFEDGKVKDDATIGFELQLNTGVSNGARDGILTWNGVTTQAYNNAYGYGDVTLELAGRQRITHAQRPTISSNPASGLYKLGVDTIMPLSVTAAISDEGTLSYQWYEADASGETGTPVGIDSPTFTPTISSAATKFYYVVVTNTNTNPNINGQTTRSATSSYARVQVYAGQLSEIVGLSNGAYALYKFELPAGAKWSDYTGISVEYKVDEDNLAKEVRGHRLMGNYKASDISSSGHITLATATNAPYIIDNYGGTYNWASLGNPAADTWFTVEYDIEGKLPSADPPGAAHADFLVANVPGANETGPFWFALGITAQEGATITQEIRNVTLVSSDGSKDVISTGSGFGEGQGSVAYSVSQVTREIKITPP